ncbi:NAD(P)-dependent oxidoreductase [Microlunatus panaciterrae]|uniref:Nucleoside-diphosphate-sugar epimerase n=1 Tax=Microlunatus panaciterrae TaxID=400768 RepID=A0ABS2RKG8_9ACTN|nr:NAD(P)-dependent oxidoreductase [Microlunatus panaciterrae]MBM7798439.1 nucleoside-diphosphate-sugar epimerase [Microlunatus panaciterrae]
MTEGNLRVAVTGGGGRLGVSVVTGLAAAGHEVISIDRHRHPTLPAQQIVADLTDNEAADAALAQARPEALVHLAAIAVPFTAPEHVILQTNTAIAFQTLQAAVAHGTSRILVASSPTPLGYGSPLGWQPDYLPIDEKHRLRPWNAYALSKMTMESIVAMFTAQYGDKIRLGSFRPCFVISPDEWNGAPTQQGHTVRERLDDPALAAVSLFNYVDARDAADFVDRWLRAAHQLPNGDVFFVGASDAMARRPLCELMPQFHPGTEELSAGLTGTAPAFSVAKAEALLGWRPKRSWRTELVDDVAADSDHHRSRSAV